MTSRIFLRRAMQTVMAGLLLMSTAVAMALSPPLLWQTPNASGGIFSGDGSSILLKNPSGFEMRRSSDGALESAITLPSGSRGYNAYSFSPNKQYVAIALHSGSTRIELWRVATGTLERTIAMGQIRSVKSVDLSSTGLLSTYERFAYGTGGNVRIYRVSDGTLLTTQGPFTRNSNTDARFSRDGQYLAVQDFWQSSGVRVLSSSNWSTVLTIGAPGNAASLFGWAADGSLWTTNPSLIRERRLVPSGTIVQTSPAVYFYYFRAVTPDNRFFLAESVDQDSVDFVRASDGTVPLSYDVGFEASAGTINPGGILFTYSIWNGSFSTIYVARTPSL
jgi:hypothetical protein